MHVGDGGKRRRGWSGEVAERAPLSPSIVNTLPMCKAIFFGVVFVLPFETFLPPARPHSALPFFVAFAQWLNGPSASKEIETVLSTKDRSRICWHVAGPFCFF